MTTKDQNIKTLKRLGPRPLPLHLAVMNSASMISNAALPFLKNGSLPWIPKLENDAAALTKKLEAVDDSKFSAAVIRESLRRLTLFNQGVSAYRNHPYRRRLPEPPTLWRQGATRLLDYGTEPDGSPVILVPSLINKAYVLDLAEKRSLARFLAARGFRPILVDWGAPGEIERSFTLTDYVLRLEDSIAAVLKKTSRQTTGLIGYCMGGLFALALAQRQPEKIDRLALLATPWDFHAGTPGLKNQVRALASHLDPVIDANGELSIDLIQMLFATLDPFKVPEKFCKFAATDQNSAKARDFVALEDWVNDGVPLVAAVAKETLWQWYGENAPAWGAWRIDGHPVLPEEVKTPSLVVIPSNDYIVPPPSALPLYEILPNAEKRIVSQGHISMMAGPNAARALYMPIVRWFGAKP